jgi:thioredoxin 1
MKDVTAKTFKDEVLNSSQPVIVDVWAAWCGPCVFLAPILEALSRERQDIKFVKVNAEEEGNLLYSWGVQNLPTILKFENGLLTKRVVGYMPKNLLVQQLGI